MAMMQLPRPTRVLCAPNEPAVGHAPCRPMQDSWPRAAGSTMPFHYYITWPTDSAPNRRSERPWPQICTYATHTAWLQAYAHAPLTILASRASTALSLFAGAVVEAAGACSASLASVAVDPPNPLLAEFTTSKLPRPGRTGVRSAGWACLLLSTAELLVVWRSIIFLEDNVKIRDHKCAMLISSVVSVNFFCSNALSFTHNTNKSTINGVSLLKPA